MPAIAISHRFELFVFILIPPCLNKRTRLPVAPSATMGKPAGGVRKPAAKRTEVVEPLFAHVAAEGVLFKVRSWGFRRPLPALSRVSLPGAGGIVAIDVSVPAAVNILLVECVPCYRCFRNMSV